MGIPASDGNRRRCIAAYWQIPLNANLRLMNKHGLCAVNIWVHLRVLYACLLTHVHYSHCSAFRGRWSLKCCSDKQSAEWDKYLLILNICLLKVACHWPHPSGDAPATHKHTPAHTPWWRADDRMATDWASVHWDPALNITLPIG